MTEHPNRQMPLSIHLSEEADLSAFCFNTNALLESQLQAALAGRGERFLYLWGHKGCGKSHLLQACCAAFQDPALTTYLPLNLLKEFGPLILEGLEHQALVTLDDIDAIANDPLWEEALFHFYNRIRDTQNLLIVSATMAPKHLNLKLPDLKSRLCSGLTLFLNELTDEDKIDMLMSRSHQRGFALPRAVAQYLVSRCHREMHALTEVLNQLDEASLAAQRKITIPFVKEILNL
jgi:DnaA family protein